MEEHVDTQTVTLKAWHIALFKLQGLQPRLLHVISPLIRDWFALLMTPLGVPRGPHSDEPTISKRAHWH